MSTSEPVTRSSLRNVKPIVAPIPMLALPERVFSDDEWRRIRRGYASRDMDERWDVFVEEQTVFVHRSWTGFEIFAATMVPAQPHGWRIGTAVVESELERHRRTSHEYDRVVLELVLVMIVLGQPAPALLNELDELSRRASGRDLPPELVRHSVVGLRTATD
ncbi:hypothetical protein Val02_31050 [Virgisporangium aliadipatigenens]|uniref:Uncharacterized protein n=1 Tax=Virgisporangium aliadipatigenens TaxID=741659 RepID=A0A8J3YJ15_9ACTN|nr:hypothetical protein [Virgisporangium aliadipatigenens]GIJ46219.1 hypothetical protein Val02_31050 [Virgisporangium aliadipatigenens]